MYPKLLQILWFAALCFFSACTHYYYAPNTIQTPFLQKQHDAQVSMGLIGGDEFNGWEAQGVYSPVKYGAVMFNHFQVRHGRGTSDPNTDSGKGRLTEFGLGLYIPATGINTFSLFGGWGAGRVVNYYGAEGRSDLRFQRWFVQPGFTAQGEWARFGLAGRFNRLEFLRGDITFDIGDQHLETIGNIEQSSPIFVPEVCLSFGFGAQPVWFDFAFNFNVMQDKAEYGFARSTVGLSLRLDLNELIGGAE